MIRLAAVGDVHVGADSAGLYRSHWLKMREQADVFLLAGDSPATASHRRRPS